MHDAVTLEGVLDSASAYILLSAPGESCGTGVPLPGEQAPQQASSPLRLAQTIEAVRFLRLRVISPRLNALYRRVLDWKLEARLLLLENIRGHKPGVDREKAN